MIIPIEFDDMNADNIHKLRSDILVEIMAHTLELSEQMRYNRQNFHGNNSSDNFIQNLRNLSSCLSTEEEAFGPLDQVTQKQKYIKIPEKLDAMFNSLINLGVDDIIIEDTSIFPCDVSFENDRFSTGANVTLLVKLFKGVFEKIDEKQVRWIRK